MKVVKLKAGLGNQMFQYAFARLLEIGYGIDDVRIDISYFDNPGMRKYLDNGIELLNVHYKVASKDDLKTIRVPYNNNTPHHLQHRLVAASQALLNKNYYFEKTRQYQDVNSILKYSYFDGYWQSWRYLDPIKEIVRKEFTPRNKLSSQSQEYINRYRTCESVFVGVRRGDYLANNKEAKHYGAPSIEYYERAIKLANERLGNPTFIIFSDDIEWVKQTLDFTRGGIDTNKIEYRTSEKIYDNFEEMYVMSSCKHAIVSNSTFNFWGAWLEDNQNKLVIAPKDWFKDGSPIDIFPPRWIQI